MIKVIDQPYTGDPPYHPEEHFRLCLSEEFVDEVLTKVVAEVGGGSENVELLNLIKEHESTHRSFVMGVLEKAERDRLISNLLDAYRQKHQRWAHQEDEYRLFYRRVNDGNWE